MNHKRFIVLISLSEKNAKLGQVALAGIRRDIDPTAAPAWIDPLGVGIFASTPQNARAVWRACFPDEQSATQRKGLKDILVLEIGRDCLGWPEAKATAWLNSHPAGDPAD
jgi:hypothetical protein